MNDLYETLKSVCQTEQNISLKTMTTLRIGGEAALVCSPASIIELMEVLKAANNAGVPCKMFGKGSDILASDRRYEGVIIRLDRHFDKYYFMGEDAVVQAGVSIIGLATAAMKAGLSGLEFASGIPGTAGGAAFMNAGAYKSSISEVVTEVLVLRDGRCEWITNEECEFGYRASVFQQHPDWIILAMRMHLTKGDAKAIETLMADRRQRRLASQPLDKPSCGSVFRNPPNVNAWQLIQDIGFRGKRRGGALVSDKHCNFIVNEDHATADDYLSLIEEIQQKVKEQFGYELHTEVEKFNW